MGQRGPLPTGQQLNRAHMALDIPSLLRRAGGTDGIVDRDNEDRIAQQARVAAAEAAARDRLMEIHSNNGTASVIAQGIASPPVVDELARARAETAEVV